MNHWFRIARRVGLIVLLLVGTLSLVGFVLAWLSGFYAFTFLVCLPWLFALGAGFDWIRSPVRRKWTAMVLGVSLGTLLVPMCFPDLVWNDINQRLQVLGHRAQVSAALPTQDRLSIYSLGLLMGVAGWAAGYPEVAWEHFGLYVPGSRVRSFHSDFPMTSVQVQRTLTVFVQQLKSRVAGIRALDLAPVTLAFTYGKDPMRIALALSPMVLSARATQDPGTSTWRLVVVAKVPIAYPRGCEVAIPTPWSRTAIRVKESMFWSLQQAGWLFPYTAHWTWGLESTDPRLHTPEP